MRYFVILLMLWAGVAAAQDAAKKEPAPAAPDPLATLVLDMFKEHQGRTICMLGDVPLPAVRSQVVEQLKESGTGLQPTKTEAEVAVWTRFPCPFSPYRAELLPANAKDIEGVWLFPEDSQPYRFGPKSEQQPVRREDAVTCEAVGFYPGGELRTGVVLGKRACPFRKAADLDPARKRPRVANWKLDDKGRLTVTRSDVKDHVEQWDVFVATRSFQALNMEIKAGDLVSYRRKDKNNDVNAATEFRHLQRLN
jgi:hypothetical protein